MPRFFVVVDEFRVLADELPDFVAGLVRLAAVGRSLGMHVILATQRPGGAVSADMRANLDVRVALHPEVAVNIQVNVARSPEEADLQKDGVDVMSSMFEKDESGFTEDYDPNAEPGESAFERPQAEKEAEEA